MTSEYMCNQSDCLAKVVVVEGQFVHLDGSKDYDHSAKPLLVSSYQEAIERGRLNDAAPALYEFASAFLEWAENHAGIFTWVEHPDQPSSLLAADEGWIGLIGMADEATAAAREGAQP